MSKYDQAKEPTDSQRALLQELMNLYGRDVWNLAYSLTRKADLADDISQDVFFKAYQRMDSLRSEASVKFWLLKITRNTAFDYSRSFFLKKVTLLGGWLERDTHPSAETEAYDKIKTDLVWDVVLRLPVKYREVLVLYGHYDLAISDIAEVLDIGEATAKTRLHRARKKAMQLLKEGEMDEGT